MTVHKEQPLLQPNRDQKQKDEENSLNEIPLQTLPTLKRHHQHSNSLRNLKLICRSQNNRNINRVVWSMLCQSVLDLDEAAFVLGEVPSLVDEVLSCES